MSTTPVPGTFSEVCSISKRQCGVAAVYLTTALQDSRYSLQTVFPQIWILPLSASWSPSQMIMWYNQSWTRCYSTSPEMASRW
jgi:hypothetical protein